MTLDLTLLLFQYNLNSLLNAESEFEIPSPNFAQWTDALGESHGLNFGSANHANDFGAGVRAAIENLKNPRALILSQRECLSLKSLCVARATCPHHRSANK